MTGAASYSRCSPAYKEEIMGIEDLASSESAVVAAATATVLSPRVRETLRRGAVYGVAGALKVGDVVAGAARGAARGVRTEQMATNARDGRSARTSSAQSSPARTSSPAPARRSGGAATTRRTAGTPRPRTQRSAGGDA